MAKPTSKKRISETLLVMREIDRTFQEAASALPDIAPVEQKPLMRKLEIMISRGSKYLVDRVEKQFKASETHAQNGLDEGMKTLGIRGVLTEANKLLAKTRRKL